MRVTATWMRCVLAAFACLASASAASAQTKSARFGFVDNSFLIEEAFNQDPGIFQNIFVFSRSRDGQWEGAFTQEWPLASRWHQASFSLPFTAGRGAGEVGDVVLNYRLQAWTEEAGRPAFSPRVSLILPTSRARRPLGGHGLGWQVNLPFSKQVGALYLHANGGATWSREPQPAGGRPEPWLTTLSAGGSVVAAVTPMVHLMLEAVVESARNGAAGRETNATFSPGIRAGWNAGAAQWVLGLGVPVTRGATHEWAVLSYVSCELPFRRR